MSEEIKTPQEAENAQAASSKKFAQVFLVPNIINLVAVVCMIAMLAMMLVMPVYRIGTEEGTQLEGYTGENEITYSGLEAIRDVIKEFDIEKDEGAFATPENPGNFSKAVTLLAFQSIADYGEAMAEYQEQVDVGNTNAQKPTEPALNSRLSFVIPVAVPALLPLLACTIAVVVSLIKAVKRCFVCKPYPKLNDNFGILVGPVAMVGIALLMRYVGVHFQHIHFVENNLLVMLVLGIVILVLDIVCYAMAKNLSKKHYSYQA